MNKAPMPNLSLVELRHLCAEETDNFQQRRPYDPAYCFELFRRAAVDRDEAAWSAIYHQYLRQVLSWIRRNPMFPMMEEEEQYFANRAFERMWGAMTPEKWSKFPNLKSLLRYLQMCCHSVLVDYSRQKEQATLKTELDELMARQLPDEEAQVEVQVMDGQERHELWALIQQELADDREMRVIYAKFVLGMKPAQIAQRFNGMFSDVKDVYRVSEAAMDHLRNSPALADYFEAE